MINNSFIKRYSAKIKKIENSIILLLPTQEMVVFTSFNGLYNDNPRYISECLHRKSPKTRIYWVIGENTKESVPEYITMIKPSGLKYEILINTAKVVVDNFTGIRRLEKNRPSQFGKVYTKSKSRYNISTWHGTPLKKIGFDTPGVINKEYFYTSTNYLIAGCEYVKDVFSTAFPGVEVRMYGTPRNDCLCKCVSESKNIVLRKKLRLPLDKKIVLFAPTFRSDIYESGIHQLEEIDIPQLLQRLHDKFNGDWIFVYRVHHEVYGRIDFERLSENEKENVFAGNQGDDMAEYLQITDALITDYSGSMFDFVLTGKPCWLFALDRKHYENVERGFYMPISELPFTFAESLNELYKAIEAFDPIDYEKKANKFLELIGNVEDGNASEKIAEDILSFLSK